MEAQALYKIGTEHQKQHLGCFDYALCGDGLDFAYAIVCAGDDHWECAEFGAMALALSARETLRVARTTDLDAELFGTLAIGKAMTTSALFPMVQPTAFTSTLLVAWIYRGKMRAYLYGDGLFMHKNHSGTHAVHVSFKPDCPDYLAYETDDRRKADYLAKNINKRVYDCILDAQLNESGSESLILNCKPVVIESSVMTGDIIGVFSSGIERIYLPNAQTPLTWRELINRNAVEDFSGYVHTEDISLAVIKV